MNTKLALILIPVLFIGFYLSYWLQTYTIGYVPNLAIHMGGLSPGVQLIAFTAYLGFLLYLCALVVLSLPAFLGRKILAQIEGPPLLSFSASAAFVVAIGGELYWAKTNPFDVTFIFHVWEILGFMFSAYTWKIVFGNGVA